MPSKFQEMLKLQRQNAETSRAGLKWESDEDERLMTQVKQGVSLSDIAKNLQRTEGSIKTRLIIYAIKRMEDDGLSIADASREANVSQEDITEYIERRNQRAQKKINRTSYDKKNTNITNADIYKLIYEMNSNLQTLLAKK